MLQGKVQRVGVSRGKSLASWNGIPSGERYLEVIVDKGDIVMIWYPEHSDSIDRYVGREIRIEGEWFTKEMPEDYMNTQHPLEKILDLPSEEELGTLDDLVPESVTEISDISSDRAYVEEKIFVPMVPKRIFIAQKIDLFQ